MRFVITLIPLAAAAVPARASLSVCNKTEHGLTVAVGYFDGRHWVSEGWWRVAVRKCAEIITGHLDARYYYLYATDGASSTWDGGTYFCVDMTGKFLIAGRGACEAHGLDHRGFFEVDTENRLDWTQTLSD